MTDPAPVPSVTAVIVAYNDATDLAELLPALTGSSVEVIVVDNASNDDSASVAASAGATVIALPDNTGWTVASNRGGERASGDVIAFVNPDARPDPTDLGRLAALLDAPDAGIAAPRFVEPSGDPQPFYFRFPTPLTGLFLFFGVTARIDRLLGRPFVSRRTYGLGRELPTEVDAPGAACVAMRAEVFRELGGFDERMFLFFSDTDMCRRLAQRGRRAVVDWDLDVVHRGGGSVGRLHVHDLQHQLRADYLTYARLHYGPVGRAVTLLAYVLLGGVVPAAAQVARGRPGEARRALTWMWDGLRRARRGRRA